MMMMMIAVSRTISDNIDDSSYCGRQFDNVTCWPETEAGHLAVEPCPSHFQGLQLSEG